MRYWPLSVIVNSPLMAPAYAMELFKVCATQHLSQGAFLACSDVTARTKPVETCMAIVESVNAPMRRVYTEYPDFEEWMALERSGFVLDESGFFGFVIDALH